MGLDAGDRIGNGNQVGKRLLRFDAVAGRIRLVTLDIKAKCGARSARAGKAQHDARTAFEQDADALIFADRLIDRIVIGKIIRRRDLQIAVAGAGKRGEFFAQGCDQRVGGVRIHFLIVMAGIIVAAIFGPVFCDDVLHAFLARGDNVQPVEHGPQAVLFAHMVGTRAEAFFATDRHLAGIHEIAEKFPAGRRFIHAKAKLFGHTVRCRTRRHRTGNAGNAGGITRGQFGIGRDDGEAVGRGDEHALADHHVAVAIAIGGRAEIGAFRAHDVVIKLLGVDKVRVGVVAAEIRQRRCIADRALRRAEALFDDLHGIGTGNGAHGIDHDPETAGDQRADGGEIEQFFHQGGVIGNRIDHLDRQFVHLEAAHLVEIDIGGVGDFIAVDNLRAGIDRIGDLFRCGAAIADIVFDAEIFVRAAGIVAGGKHDAAKRLVFADDVGGGRRRENATLTDQNLAETGSGGHFDRLLDDFAVVITAVAADHQRLALKALKRVEDRLDEILGVIFLCEDWHLLAQAGCARLLVLIGLRLNGLDHCFNGLSK